MLMGILGLRRRLKLIINILSILPHCVMIIFIK
jgi:hypothetical protein